MRNIVDYILRPATQDDYPYCYKLTKRNMYDLCCRYWGGWVPSKFRAGFDPQTISMIMINGRRSGYLSVQQREGNAYISEIQISSTYHGKGVGTKILQNLLTERNQETFGLTVYETNPAKKIYDRLVFIVVENKAGVIKMVRKPSHK